MAVMLAVDIGMFVNKKIGPSGKVLYVANKNFNWVDSVHKMRKLGLNFRIFLGLYVTPRSLIDNRNILEV